MDRAAFRTDSSVLSYLEIFLKHVDVLNNSDAVQWDTSQFLSSLFLGYSLT